MNEEHHYINRSNWLRAAVLGANDGILSTASIAIGIAAATTTREPIVLGAVAGLVAGTFSMAAGEYVSVSSQSDIEEGDIQREKEELAKHPEEELLELRDIYIERGLEPGLALEVAQALSATPELALATHIRDELELGDASAANPLQAAWASGLAFTIGGALPTLVAFLAPLHTMITCQYVFSLIFLLLLGAVSAKTGGSSIPRAMLRLALWGSLAMGATAFVGSLFGVS